MGGINEGGGVKKKKKEKKDRQICQMLKLTLVILVTTNHSGHLDSQQISFHTLHRIPVGQDPLTSIPEGRFLALQVSNTQPSNIKQQFLLHTLHTQSLFGQFFLFFYNVPWY